MRTQDEAPRTGPAGILHAARGPILIAAAVLAVAVAALAMAVTPQVASYPDGSPEAALQRYLMACDAGDVDAAYAALSPSTQQRVSRRYFEQELGRWRRAGPPRAWVERVDVSGDRATVRLRLAWPGGFMDGGDPEGRAVRLSSVDDTWRIDDAIVGLVHQD